MIHMGFWAFLFNALDEKEMKIVIDAMEEKKYADGDKVIVQNDDGNELFVIDSGVLTCVRQFVNTILTTKGC